MAATAMALPLFAVTLFVSAFLLFLVQPMIGKMILPSLGGTPQVWNTCMVFFQTALLAGYAYTHTVSTKLKLRFQLLLHGVLLLLPVLLLFGMGSFNSQIKDWIPPAGSNPIPATLLILTIVVGIPFFVVSTSAPLLQKWFSFTGHPAAKDPYFLYGASNLGSMLSLVFYPFLIEPLIGLESQSWTWAYGYVLLVGLFFVCVSMVWKSPATAELPGAAKEDEAAAAKKTAEVKEEKREKVSTGITAKKGGASSVSTRIRKGSKQKGKSLSKSIAPGKPVPPPRSIAYTEERSDVMTPWRRLRWVLLAACPSSLMLGIITYISTDVSAIPLFWVIPLALYLLSFILVFARWPVVWTREPHTLMVIGHPFVFLGFIWLVLTGQISPIYRSIAFSILAFFLTAMVCHGEMARDRPTTKHLTEFYLWMSVGGMLGGVFNALMAPVLFWGVAELPIALVLACLLRPRTNKLAPVDRMQLMVFCVIMGLIFGFAALSMAVGPLAGAMLGAIVGAVLGYYVHFDPYHTNGWTEELLIRMFPDLGTWADEKGKEMAEAGGDSTTDEAAEEEGSAGKKKKLVKKKAPPDYYLLNFAMDFGLPLVLGVFIIIFVNNAGAITDGLEFVCSKTFGMTEQFARTFAVRLGHSVIPIAIPLLVALAFTFRPLRFGLAIGMVFLVHSYHPEAEDRREILRLDRSYFGVLKVMRDEGTNYWHMFGLPHVLNQQDPQHKKLYKLRLEEMELLGEKEPQPAPYHYLMHGTTHHGLNYQSPPGLRRLATTYYHRRGPVGVVMDKFDWWPGPQNTYWADARMPATLIASSLTPLGVSNFPTEQVVSLWSEPPYATVGLGTGTMASYGRPLQHVTFYEIDNKIRAFNLDTFDLPDDLFLFSIDVASETDHVSELDMGRLTPNLEDEFENNGYTLTESAQVVVKIPESHWRIIDKGKPFEVRKQDDRLKIFRNVPGPYFNYLWDAIHKRAVNIELVMGDARISMKEDVEAKLEEQREEKMKKYNAETLREFNRSNKWRDGHVDAHRENYYFAIELDAFSSDAIPVHLITKEAIKLYFEKLSEQGILLVHTSNRHVDLVPPVIDIVTQLRKEDPFLFSIDPASELDPEIDPASEKAKKQLEAAKRQLEVDKKRLNEGKLTQHIREEFEKNKHDLSGDAQVKVKIVQGRKMVGSQWQIMDNGEHFEVRSQADKLHIYKDRLPKDLYPLTEMVYRVCNDLGEKGATGAEIRSGERGHFQSEYVIIARKEEYLPEVIQDVDEAKEVYPYHIWLAPAPPANFRTWTDDFSNMMSVFRWGFKQ